VVARNGFRAGYHSGSERVRSWLVDVGAHLARAKTALTCSSLTGSPVNVCRRAGMANKQVLGVEAQSEPVGEVGLELGELSGPILGRNNRV
jgi:hypothetical protein